MSENILIHCFVEFSAAIFALFQKVWCSSSDFVTSRRHTMFSNHARPLWFINWISCICTKKFSIFIGCTFIKPIHVPFVAITDVENHAVREITQWFQRYVINEWDWTCYAHVDEDLNICKQRFF